MKYSEAVKPISYLKTHASEIVNDLCKNQKTMIITQNGNAKVVVQDIHLYEKTQDSLALLKILAMSSKNLNDGNFKPINKSFKNIRNSINK